MLGISIAHRHSRRLSRTTIPHLRKLKNRTYSNEDSIPITIPELKLAPIIDDYARDVCGEFPLFPPEPVGTHQFSFLKMLVETSSE